MGVLLTVFCQALSAVLSQPEHPIINPFLLVTWQQSMSEQAIETVAIKWTPVNPMGYLLRAYGKGREFFPTPYCSYIHTIIHCHNLKKRLTFTQASKIHSGTLTDDSNIFITFLQPSAASVNIQTFWSLYKYLCLCQCKARTMKPLHGKVPTWCFWTHRNESAITKNIT